MMCKDCTFCVWACPGWMCANGEHPDSKKKGEDYPVFIKLEDDGCDLFYSGDNDYKKIKRELDAF